MNIIFIAFTNQKNNIFNDKSVLYRCLFIGKELERLGNKITIIESKNFFDNYSLEYDIYVFFRPNKTINNFECIINILKKNKKILFASYDDLIFSKRLAPQAPSIVNNFDKLEKIEQYFLENELTLHYFDKVIVSTACLKNEIIKIVPNIEVNIINNFIPDNIYDFTNSRYVHEVKRNFQIGYMCGTASHNNDFKIIEDVLIKYALDYPNIKILIVGPLTNDTDLFKLDNVYRVDAVGYEGMFYFLSQCNFVIAPLVKNEFNFSKSNIKFLESQVVFTRLIVQSGFSEFDSFADEFIDCADNKNDWYNYFNRNYTFYNNKEYINSIKLLRLDLKKKYLLEIKQLLTNFS